MRAHKKQKIRRKKIKKVEKGEDFNGSQGHIVRDFIGNDKSG